MNPTIIFPSDPDASYKPDFAFADECDAARAAGFDVAFFNLGIHFGGEPEFRKLPDIPSSIVYRGWILTEENYKSLAVGLYQAGAHQLITTPKSYGIATNLPQWYPSIGSLTPRSFWIKDAEEPKKIAEEVKRNTYGQPLILKDYLKSRKHEWNDACFIPDSWDVENVARVITNFKKLQGDSLWGGLVFRDYIKFKELRKHPTSGSPIIHEVRQFYFSDGKKPVPFFQNNYWPDYDQEVETPPQHVIESVGEKVNLPFFVVDFGLTEEGYWIPIEVNDGGSAGLPNVKNAPKFYLALFHVLENRINMIDALPICSDCAKGKDTQTPGLLSPEFVCGFCKQTLPRDKWAGKAFPTKED